MFKNFSSNTRRSALALGVGLLVTGGALASAASLSIGTSSIGAATSVIASCDTDGVTLTYSTAYDSASGAYVVNSVTVGDIASGCNGLQADVTLKDGSNVSLASLQGTVSGTTLSLGTNLGLNPENIAGSAIIIANQ